ncbi:MAG TPA: hypothetical protein VEP49_00420 [Acidimicrobiia bacterium]|nr:hypothetical protein [Acidimicrobiia bacterium]
MLPGARRVGSLVTAWVLAALLFTLAPVGAARAADADPTATGYRYLQHLFARGGRPTDAKTLSAAGSLAASNVDFWLAINDAYRISGAGQPNRQTFVRKGKTVQGCSTEKPTASTVAPSCTTYANFKLDKQHRLVSFTVDGKSLAGRYAVGGPPATAMGVSLAVRAAYRSATTNALIIVLSVTGAPDGPRQVFLSSSSYVDRGGPVLQATPELVLGSKDAVPPSATTTMSIVYPGASLGGVLQVPVFETVAPFTSEVAQLRVG